MERPTLTQRGRQIVFHGNHGYSRSKVSKNGSVIYWRCLERHRCNARIHTDSQTGQVIGVVGQHIHPADPTKEDVLRCNTSLKEQARASRERTKLVLQHATRGIAQDALPLLASPGAMKRRVHSVRSRPYPPVPVDRQNFNIPRAFQVTLNGEPFLIFDSKEIDPLADRVIIFSSRFHMQRLAQSRHWFVDGTFKTTPPNFDNGQIYTIHCLMQHTVQPCIYGILPNKTQETYLRFFEAVCQSVQPMQMEPRTVMCDFELAAMNAVKTLFPNARVSGCLFHLSQSVYRRVQMVGLQARYEQNPAIQLGIRRLSALALLPPDLVRYGYVAALTQMPAEAIQVANFFEQTYLGAVVGGRWKEPRFPIEDWNQFQRVVEGLPRTNNNVEGWHYSFNSSVEPLHPTIWKLIEAFQEDEGEGRRKILHLVANPDYFPKPRLVYQRVDRNLKRAVTDFNDDTDVFDFLTTVAYQIKV